MKQWKKELFTYLAEKEPEKLDHVKKALKRYKVEFKEWRKGSGYKDEPRLDAYMLWSDTEEGRGYWFGIRKGLEAWKKEKNTFLPGALYREKTLAPTFVVCVGKPSYDDTAFLGYQVKLEKFSKAYFEKVEMEE